MSVGTVEPGAGTVQEWVSRSGVCGMFGRYRKPPLEPTYNTLQKATSGKATPAAGDQLLVVSAQGEENGWSRKPTMTGRRLRV